MNRGDRSLLFTECKHVTKYLVKVYLTESTRSVEIPLTSTRVKYLLLLTNLMNTFTTIIQHLVPDRNTMIQIQERYSGGVSIGPVKTCRRTFIWNKVKGDLHDVI